MKRVALSLMLVLVSASLGLTGCQKKVEVQTGTRTMCTYGHEISNTVKTVSVPAKDAGKYRIKTVTKVCDRHRKVQSLYDQAQDAIAAGDMKTAGQRLEQVIALDPAFRNAKKQSDEIKKGTKPTADKGGSSNTGGTTKPPAPGDEGGETPATGLLKWAPDSIAGFKAERAVLDAFAASRVYVPEKSDPMIQMVIIIEQFRDSASAKSALDRDVKLHYDRDKRTIKINGHSVYSATDGRYIAVMAFTDGAQLVSVEGSAKSEGQAKAMLAALEAAIKQLP